MTTTVFRDVRVFPGWGDALLPPHDVVVEGRVIAAMSPHDPASVPTGEATIIDGGGRTLMPGLIDAHWHAAFTTVTAFEALIADPYYLLIVAGQQATATVMRGLHDGA